MKALVAYHGTSFENACQILNSEYWEYPIEIYLKGEYEVYKKLGKNEYLHKEIKHELGIHFSTSLSHAKSYAMQYPHPVILFTRLCINPGKDIYITHRIPIKNVKCIDTCVGVNAVNYGRICNILYLKKYDNMSIYGNDINYDQDAILIL
jgi:hypothetical protein